MKHLNHVVTESIAIPCYLDFDRLIGRIEGAVYVILQINKKTADDDAFWDNVEPVHIQLRDAVTVELKNFDVTRFEEYHQGKVSGARPTLERQIQESNALFTIQREQYVSRLHQAMPQVGQIRGFGSQIIEGVCRSLLDFQLQIDFGGS